MLLPSYQLYELGFSQKMRALLKRLEVQFASSGCGLRWLSWDSEGQVLGRKGPSAEAENKVQEKGRGRERCGEEPTPGKPHLWKRVCLRQGRAPGQSHRPNNSLLILSEERSPGLWEGRASHSQGCGQLCQGHFPWHRGHTGKAAVLKPQKVGQPSPPQLCQEALSCRGPPRQSLR